MISFVHQSDEERRKDLHRKAYVRAVRRSLAPLRREYVGRRFTIQGERGPYVAKVERIDDEGNVLMTFNPHIGSRLCYMAVFSRQRFLQAVVAGRMVRCS